MTVFLAINGLNWGKGLSLKEAKKNMRKFGSSMYKGKESMFYAFETKSIDDVWIDDIGSIHYKKEDKLLVKSVF